MRVIMSIAGLALLAAAGCQQPRLTEVNGVLPDDHPRVYVAGRTAEPIVIDGILDEAAWKQAPRTELYIDIEGPSMPTPSWDTRGAMVWDDTYFYFAAWLEEPDLWGTLTKRDSIIYHDNDWEIFIDPDGDQIDYLEFEINALGTEFDLKLTRGYRWGGQYDIEWDMDGMVSAVHLDGTINDPSDRDRGWTIEVAIPWSCMKPHAQHIWCPPRNDDIWFVNFSRVQWPFEIVDGAYVKPEGAKENNWVWSPQFAIDMHRPEYWGQVQFTDAAPGTTAFTPDEKVNARTQMRRIQAAVEQFRADRGELPESMADLDGLWIPVNDQYLEAPEFERTEDSWVVRFRQTGPNVIRYWTLGPDVKLDNYTIW